MFVFFVVLGMIFEGFRLVVRIAGKLAGALFVLAVFFAASALAGSIVGFIWRILPGAVLVLLLLSLITYA